MTTEELQSSLEAHKKYLAGEKGGAKADLSRASSGWASTKEEAIERWERRVLPSDKRRLCFENGHYTHEGD
ncbi:hypothetical protein Holit_01601 [Hollandina sp. SP2]